MCTAGLKRTCAMQRVCLCRSSVLATTLTAAGTRDGSLLPACLSTAHVHVRLCWAAFTSHFWAMLTHRCWAGFVHRHVLGYACTSTFIEEPEIQLQVCEGGVCHGWLQRPHSGRHNRAGLWQRDCIEGMCQVAALVCCTHSCGVSPHVTRTSSAPCLAGWCW